MRSRKQVGEGGKEDGQLRRWDARWEPKKELRNLFLMQCTILIAATYARTFTRVWIRRLMFSPFATALGCAAEGRAGWGGGCWDAAVGGQPKGVGAGAARQGGSEGACRACGGCWSRSWC